MALQGTLFLMPSPEEYRVLTHLPATAGEAPTGGGGPGDAVSTITVPGNASAIAARGVSAMFAVEEVDANHVTLTLPTTMDLADIDTLSSQLLYVFGAPPVNDLGWLTVTAEGILGLADSSDPDDAPDYVPVAGTVTLTPTLTRPVRINSTGQFLALSTVTVVFDSDGEMSYDGIKNVHLIAPLWADLSNTSWKWSALISPGSGQSWSSFTVSFTGAPGAIINLGTLV